MSHNSEHSATFSTFVKLVSTGLLIACLLSSMHVQAAWMNTENIEEYPELEVVELEDFHLNGDARLLADRIRLTPNLDWKKGSAFLEQTLPDDYSFNAYFEFEIHGGDGADGLVFVVQGDGPNAIGSGGGNLGYSGIEPSIAVEFDTWGNISFDPCYGGCDSSDNHIGINRNGNLASLKTARPSELRSKKWHVWTDYNGDVLEVRMNTSDSRPDSPIITYTLDLSSIIGSDQNVWVGFTASTGRDSDYHDIFAFRFGEDESGDDDNDDHHYIYHPYRPRSKTVGGYTEPMNLWNLSSSWVLLSILSAMVGIATLALKLTDTKSS